MNIQPSNSLKLSANWKSDFELFLSRDKIPFERITESGYSLIRFTHCDLVINLIDIDNNFQPDNLINLQSSFKALDKRLVHLWEDVWLSRSTQVLYRIKSLIGENIRIHGRKTKVLRLDKPSADSFLNENHLQGAVSSRHKFGLFYADELVAVATFSALRRMNHTEDYKSTELIRYAVKGGFSVQGGFSKLIKHLKDEIRPNDIMTYADRDWSAGEAYLNLGFEQKGILRPQYFELDESYNRKIDKQKDAELLNRVFNTGSIKFILKY